MPKQKFIVEIDTNEHGNWEGSIIDASGKPVHSCVISTLVVQISCLAEQAAANEAAQQLIVGGLYWWRGRHGVDYTIIDSVENQVVMVRESDKDGQVDQNKVPFQFYRPQRLVLAKNQPA